MIGLGALEWRHAHFLLNVKRYDRIFTGWFPPANALDSELRRLQLGYQVRFLLSKFQLRPLCRLYGQFRWWHCVLDTTAFELYHFSLYIDRFLYKMYAACCIDCCPLIATSEMR